MQKWNFINVKNAMKMFEFLHLRSMYRNIVVIQVLDRVYNVTFPYKDLYTYRQTARGI